MSVTRGEFLKALGKSLPGMVLGGGAVAAQKLLGKIAAVGGETAAPLVPNLREARTNSKPAPAVIIRSGLMAGNQIALTFDDGPTPGVTDRILDELKAREAKATFFMIGRQIAAAPDLARRVMAEGHDIGNHTFTHPKLTELPLAHVEEEIQKTQDIMAETLGLTPAWFRPPYLAFRDNLAPLVQSRGMRIVYANVDPGDWAQPGEEKIIEVITRETKPGAIILCHDMYQQTANALGPVLDQLLHTGFAPVNLSTLLAS